MDDTVASRARAYDEHYRVLWRACCFTRERIEASLAYILDVEQGGNVNGNELQCALKAIGVPDISGMRILDYCCGTGVTAVYFAMLKAEVQAFDRSPEAIRIAKQNALLSGMDSEVHFSVVDARWLPYPNETFDAVFCQSALHIVADYPECPNELARVLKPGGKAVFCEEALGYNPAVEMARLFRRQKYRNCGGRPLKHRDLIRFGRPFSRMQLTHMNLFSQAKQLLGGRLYTPWGRRVLQWTERLDHRLLSMMPALRWLCGKVVVEYIK